MLRNTTVRFSLSRHEKDTARRITQSLATAYPTVEDPNFLADVSLYAHDLPRRLRKFLNDFRLSGGVPAHCVVSGFPINKDGIGPTPSHWDQRSGISTTLPEEIFMMLCCALVGDAFGWATQQGGYLVHDVIPVKGFENTEMGISSGGVLKWHTEDAFHNYRADHVAMMCLRNPDRTATTVGELDLSMLTQSEIDCLFEPRFMIRADVSHKPEFAPDEDRASDLSEIALRRSYEALARVEEDAEMVPILSGRRDAPYICADPIYAEVRHGDNEAAAALHAFEYAIDGQLNDVVLAPGDVLFVDNFKAVHGRQSFNAKYDGSDRWLKRINVTSDLRKSADARTGELPRLIY